MTEHQHMEQWAREAGAYALNIFHDIHAAPPKAKADHSWVTEADLAVERMLRERIAAAYPDDRIMGEEEGGSANAEGRIWVIDPIDGTGSFVKRLPVWCVSIGLLIDGKPAAGCVYLPVTDECYLAGITGDATLNGEPINAHVENPLDSQAWMCVPSNAHYRYNINYRGKTRSLGSTAANICYVARGSASAAILGRASLWDIAGAMPILERAGGVLQPLNGEPLDWQTLYTGKAASQVLFASSQQNLELMLSLINEC